jgi:hypothetical protein
MLDGAGKLVAVSLMCYFYVRVSEVFKDAEGTESAECSSTLAWPGSSLSCRGHGFLCTSSSGYLCRIPARTAWSHNEGCRLERGVAGYMGGAPDFRETVE